MNMKISKPAAQLMTLAGFGVCLLTSVPTFIMGTKGSELTNAARELAATPLYRAAERLDEIARETEARVTAIENCLDEHFETETTSVCLDAATALFDYTQQTQEETAQLRTAFPGYQAALDEMETLNEKLRDLDGSLPWIWAGLLISGSTAIAGRVAYRRREREEEAAGKAQHPKVSELYPK